MNKQATRRTYHLYTYDDIWADTKKKLNFTDEQLRKQVESALQMNAWVDVMDGVVNYVEYVKILNEKRHLDVSKTGKQPKVDWVGLKEL
jgi:hypothetical protein